MRCYMCKHPKKYHTRTVAKDGHADSLGCEKDSCTRFQVRCNEYFRPEPNPEMLDGRCELSKGHEGNHYAILMYQM